MRTNLINQLQLQLKLKLIDTLQNYYKSSALTTPGAWSKTMAGPSKSQPSGLKCGCGSQITQLGPISKSS
jgi:hypothetical protein